MNLTAVIVSYKSSHLLDELILDIPKNFEIIIIENSLDTNLKKLETKYENVKVIFPNKNLGLGKAINLGLSKSANNFVWCLCPDVKISTKCYNEIYNLLNHFDDFSLISPTYFDEKNHKNYKSSDMNLNDNIRLIKNYKLIAVDEIDFATVIVNKSKIDSNNMMDENIHLYFENQEVCLRFKKQGKKLYVVDNLKFIHHGTKSSDPSLKFDIQIHRNWHYCWSKFYYLKKHHNYFYAFRKTLPNLLRALKKCLIYIMKNNGANFKLHKAELSGLINSYLLRKSFYRPPQDKNLQ